MYKDFKRVQKSKINYMNEFQKQELRESTERKRQTDRHEEKEAVAITAQTEDSKDQSLGEALQNGNSKDAKECLIKAHKWTLA